MSGRSAIRLLARGLAALFLAVLAPQPVAAFEALDGRVQMHGYFESQLRLLSEDYAQEWDLSQWYQILNLELEIDLVRDTIGPLDLLSGFIRIEGRFDCVYSRGCGMIRSANVYGDRAKSLPRRLNDARGNLFDGAIEVDPDTGRLSGQRSRTVTLERVEGFATLASQGSADEIEGIPNLSADCLAAPNRGPTLCGNLAGGTGGALVASTDDPFPYVFERFLDLRFTHIQALGGRNSGRAIRQLGPWRPKDAVFANAGLADRVNPFDGTRVSPVLLAATYNTFLLDSKNPVTFNDPVNSLAQAQLNLDQRKIAGGEARPFRPIPLSDEGRPHAGDDQARGLYIPSQSLIRAIREGRVGDFPLNFSETERAFNRGASQQDEGELKEAYLDLELFDSRLWMRLGKQSIVWGKTELFRTTDQFNPQDLALSSLPSLEESRIALWAARGIWSFYEVGPLEDVRFELAFNLDDFEPADFGACGEPYTIELVCGAAFGVFAHGTTGIGLVGMDKPASPWKSLEGWEIGARVEFRYDRFSFAISDFYGYSDIPFPERITTYERNVDPDTGWPRILGARGACSDGTQPACLTPGPTTRTDSLGDPDSNALQHHHANQQLFAMICSTTVGILPLDRTACGQTAFGSQVVPDGSFFSISQVVSASLAGSRIGAIFLRTDFGISPPFVTLNGAEPNVLSNAGTLCVDDRWVNNPFSGSPATPTCGSGGAGLLGTPAFPEALGLKLTPEQEALVGCGPFWGTNCDDSGVDLLNSDATVLLQSFTGFEGTLKGWRTDDATRPQPGTVGFAGGPVCPTFHLGSGESGLKLPGCRGPGPDGLAGTADDDLGYDPGIDGDPAGVRSVLDPSFCPACLAVGTPGHPFTGQTWQNEMAALSWNFQMITILNELKEIAEERRRAGLSTGDNVTLEDAYNADGDQCSFITPQFCENIQGLLRLAAISRNVVRAGGNGRFGRRDFQWHSGGELLLRFEKRNVLGFALDFAEDRTKANLNLEFTWIEGVPVIDNDQFDGITRVDEFNLTVSVDRPTFINFLNPNRTFFFNTQWFIQYRQGRTRGFATPAWNFLGTLAVTTGYYQDRLLPSAVFVVDVHSRSWAALPEVTYRYNESFSVTVGAALFTGRPQLVDMPINEVGPTNRFGPHAYEDQAENGLSVLRDRDEIFLRLRYTF